MRRTLCFTLVLLLAVFAIGIRLEQSQHGGKIAKKLSLKTASKSLTQLFKSKSKTSDVEDDVEAFKQQQLPKENGDKDEFDDAPVIDPPGVDDSEDEVDTILSGDAEVHSVSKVTKSDENAENSSVGQNVSVPKEVRSQGVSIALVVDPPIVVKNGKFALEYPNEDSDSRSDVNTLNSKLETLKTECGSLSLIAYGTKDDFDFQFWDDNIFSISFSTPCAKTKAQTWIDGVKSHTLITEISIDLEEVAPKASREPPENLPDARVPDFSDEASWQFVYGFKSPLVTGLPGIKGDGVKMLDIEYGYDNKHKDLPPITDIFAVDGSHFTPDMSVLSTEPSWKSHGTSVLGEICALDNQVGIAGAAPNVTPLHGTAWGTFKNQKKLHINVPLKWAIDRQNDNHLEPGDVILLEQQTGVCGLGDTKYGPVESKSDVKRAMRAALLAGVYVVQAAGNGGVDLDSTPCKSLARNPVGAITVGSTKPSWSPDTKLPSSSHGAMVDVNAWGKHIITLGHDVAKAKKANRYRNSEVSVAKDEVVFLDPTYSYVYPKASWGAGSYGKYVQAKEDDYTRLNGHKGFAMFSGTSGASPIITSIVASISGMLKQAGALPFTPSEMKAALKASDVVNFGANQKVGKTPNVVKMARNASKRVYGCTFCNHLAYTVLQHEQNTPSLLQVDSGKQLDLTQPFCIAEKICSLMPVGSGKTICPLYLNALRVTYPSLPSLLEASEIDVSDWDGNLLKPHLEAVRDAVVKSENYFKDATEEKKQKRKRKLDKLISELTKKESIGNVYYPCAYVLEDNAEGKKWSDSVETLVVNMSDYSNEERQAREENLGIDTPDLDDIKKITSSKQNLSGNSKQSQNTISSEDSSSNPSKQNLSGNSKQSQNTISSEDGSSNPSKQNLSGNSKQSENTISSDDDSSNPSKTLLALVCDGIKGNKKKRACRDWLQQFAQDMDLGDYRTATVKHFVEVAKTSASALEVSLEVYLHRACTSIAKCKIGGSFQNKPPPYNHLSAFDKLLDPTSDGTCTRGDLIAICEATEGSSVACDSLPDTVDQGCTNACKNVWKDNAIMKWVHRGELTCYTALVLSTGL